LNLLHPELGADESAPWRVTRFLSQARGGGLWP
jgi:hypothetical protein